MPIPGGVSITTNYCIIFRNFVPLEKDVFKSETGIHHSVLLVLDGGDELAELLERAGDDELVVRLTGADAFELEVDQTLREAPLRLRQG